MTVKYTPGRNNVSYIEAPYETLVAAFGNDGTVDPRDDYKCEAQWFVNVPLGEVEVYDYKVGKAYNGPEGLERHEITDWHVQGKPEAIAQVVALLNAADTRSG